MKLTEYCDVLNVDLKITYGRQHWRASIDRGETKEHAESRLLGSASGVGATPDIAMRNLVDRIKGKRLVIDAMRDTRREYAVPLTLEA